MDADTRVELITRNTEEVLTKQDLKGLIEKGVPLRHYIGFEISGKVHLGTGLMAGLKIRDFQKAGVKCSCFLATYHAWINNKLGGKLETIRKLSEYFAEGLKAGIEVMGGDPDKVDFVLADELYHHNDEYWRSVIEIAKNNTLNRTLRAISIMGREEGGKVPLAFLMYPPMQVADIFAQGLTLAHSGMDQRKAHVMAREVALKLETNALEHKGEKFKPIAIHHHLLLGLQKPGVWPVPKDKLHEFWASMKMSKSIKGSAVFIDDSPDEIRSKLNKAFCPQGVVEFNPVLDWAKHIVFSRDGASLEVKRPEKFGGDITYDDFKTLASDFEKERLHPMDLKKAMAEKLVAMLEPARKRMGTAKMKKFRSQIEGLITR